jgi:hypothetical protein
MTTPVIFEKDPITYYADQNGIRDRGEAEESYRQWWEAHNRTFEIDGHHYQGRTWVDATTAHYYAVGVWVDRENVKEILPC